jgi:hypothetical protein
MEEKKKKTVTFDPVLREDQKKVIISKENIIEDCILLLNPLYSDLLTQSMTFLESLNFNVICTGFFNFSKDQSKILFSQRYKYSPSKEQIIDHF